MILIVTQNCKMRFENSCFEGFGGEIDTEHHNLSILSLIEKSFLKIQQGLLKNITEAKNYDSRKVYSMTSDQVFLPWAMIIVLFSVTSDHFLPLASNLF